MSEAEVIAGYCSAAATSTPPTIAAIIADATAHPHLYTYAALLAVPAVRALDGTAHASSLALLRVFAYGTYADVVGRGGDDGDGGGSGAANGEAASPSIPTLNPAQTLKLRRLTLMSLARGVSRLPYATIAVALDLPSTRAVEDLVIGAVYEGLLAGGRLNPRAGVVEVTGCRGRDLTPADVAGLGRGLAAWRTRAGGVLGVLGGEVDRARAVGRAVASKREEAAEAAASVAAAAGAVGGGGGGGMVSALGAPVGRPDRGGGRRGRGRRMMGEDDGGGDGMYVDMA
ncbi:hypothetical protein BU14_0197s0016 [Porphyra umbilicalis]|uniref:PCI domain-containing protein n=1 Tax=Porphyra umbilicalis TaxID=2786 RepID=A0A1X6P6F5_PORUM|nr:hypothetical protein BU14_0197s0016 [Porphyra umbilicalis]|eukprot:OSX76320.1 hypothetical protein BU14_0197s0016 [Porphyra umbilicalis]